LSSETLASIKSVLRSAGKAKTAAGRPARGGPLCTEPRRANYTGSQSGSLKLSRGTSAQTISERSFRAQPARFFSATNKIPQRAKLTNATGTVLSFTTGCLKRPTRTDRSQSIANGSEVNFRWASHPIETSCLSGWRPTSCRPARCSLPLHRQY
jgi:hypothetical protein